MADWSLLDREWLPAPPPALYNPYQYADYDHYPYYQDKPPQQQQQPSLSQQSQLTQQGQSYFAPTSPTLKLLLASPRHLSPPVPMQMPMSYMPPIPRGDNPREIRNKAEKQRRDKLNHSIAELASMVPPVVAASRKIDKTGVLRLTAHYLRAHQYVFGDSIGHAAQFTSASSRALLRLLNGFLLTTTYKGLIVVVSQNVNEFLGYTELDLLGQNIFNLTHEDDRQMLKDQLMPRSQKLGTNGELLMPEDADGRQKVAQALANEKRRFVVRFKKLGQRSEPSKYVTCHVEGSLRKSDRACRGYNRCCQMVRRARARCDNPCSSGNDVVFIGVVRPTTETFINESAMESYKMEYRTRHSIDGEIIQCEQRIALVTGYMTEEVHGVNAMNFIHRDEVRWVIIALRAMYDNNLMFGESCYRLMTKNGQFVYMSTRGRLDVDKDSRAVTSFICTNTVVNEEEGKQLIKKMKDRFTISGNNNEDAFMIEDTKDTSDNQAVSIEDPKQLEKVILHLVTNLPSASSEPFASSSEHPSSHTPARLALIPHNKERIVGAIDKIYTVFKSLPKPPSVLHDDQEPNTPNTNDFSQATIPALPFNDTYLETAVYSPEGFHYPPVGEVYNNMMPFTEELVNYPEVLNSVPGTSAGGVKRTKNYGQEEEISTKKKIMANENDPTDQTGCGSPSLEAFFDEAILNTQIESVIATFEHNIDPSFPDLLISNEVQEILGKIEDPSEDIDI